MSIICIMIMMMMNMIENYRSLIIINHYRENSKKVKTEEKVKEKEKVPEKIVTDSTDLIKCCDQVCTNDCP